MKYLNIAIYFFLGLSVILGIFSYFTNANKVTDEIQQCPTTGCETWEQKWLSISECNEFRGVIVRDQAEYYSYLGQRKDHPAPSTIGVIKDMENFSVCQLACNENDECCKESYDRGINDGNYLLTRDGLGCTDGYKENMLKCPTTLHWCEVIEN